MAGAMRKMGVYLGIVEDDRYDIDHDHDYDYDDATERQHPESAAWGGRRGIEEPVRAAAARESSRVTTMPERVPERRPHPAGAGSATSVAPAATVQTLAPPAQVPAREPYRITTIHPRTYNEARQIGEAFRAGTPVIMNLTEMSDSDAKRLVDFSAGLVFGLQGTIERVTSKVFLLSPNDVVVTAEDKARIAESGFFNQS